MKMKCYYFILAITLVVSVTACGGNKKQQGDDSSAQVDITRPPTFVKTGELNTETDPEETISAEEWRKQRSQAQ